MRRREFITFAGASVTWPFAALAQEPGRMYRLGGLFPASRENPANAAQLAELRRFGFIEGQNLTIEYRAYGQHVDLLAQYAAELVNARVDVIAAVGDEAVRAVQQATKTIPIVAFAGDLLESGLVTSLARPGGNTTGVNFLVFVGDGKRQDILIEACDVVSRFSQKRRPLAAGAPGTISHCWTAHSSGSPELFRASLMQVGVSFTAPSMHSVVFRYGPLLANACWL